MKSNLPNGATRLTDMDISAGAYTCMCLNQANLMCCAACSATSLDPLLVVLGIPGLSEQVVCEAPAILPQEPQLARQLSSCLAAALPQLQWQLMSTLSPGDYQVWDAAMLWRLNFSHFVWIRQLLQCVCVCVEALRLLRPATQLLFASRVQTIRQPSCRRL